MPPAVHPFSVAGDKCDMNKRFHLIPATSPPRSRTQPRRHPLDPTLPRGPARTRPRRPASLPSLPRPCAPKARPVCVQASTSVAAPRGPGPPTCRPRAPPLYSWWWAGWLDGPTRTTPSPSPAGCVAHVAGTQGGVDLAGRTRRPTKLSHGTRPLPAFCYPRVLRPGPSTSCRLTR